MDLSQRKTIRKIGYDYSNDGIYFITICSQNREHFFGEIEDNKMILNDLGRYTRDCRKNIPKHFPFVKIDEFICMPDHIHGILTIKSGRDANTARPNNNHHSNNQTVDHSNIQGFEDRTAHDAVPTGIRGPQYGSLGYIMNQYKGSVTKFARANNISFKRQSRYYDHIILDEKELFFIKKYIRDNPKNRNNKNFEG